MSKLLAFSGSNSSQSINFALLTYTVSLIDSYEVQLLNMAKMPFPMYSMDAEKENGFKNALVELREDIRESQGLIIAVNEHNRNVSAYFKNLIDWLSRLDINFLQDKKIFLLSTSPGKRGGKSAIDITANTLPMFGAQVMNQFSLPSFRENFSREEMTITNEDFKAEHLKALHDFLQTLGDS